MPIQRRDPCVLVSGRTNTYDCAITVWRPSKEEFDLVLSREVAVRVEQDSHYQISFEFDRLVPVPQPTLPGATIPGRSSPSVRVRFYDGPDIDFDVHQPEILSAARTSSANTFLLAKVMAFLVARCRAPELILFGVGEVTLLRLSPSQCVCVVAEGLNRAFIVNLVFLVASLLPEIAFSVRWSVGECVVPVGAVLPAENPSPDSIWTVDRARSSMVLSKNECGVDSVVRVLALLGASPMNVTLDVKCSLVLRCAPDETPRPNAYIGCLFAALACLRPHTCTIDLSSASSPTALTVGHAAADVATFAECHNAIVSRHMRRQSECFRVVHL